jgi:Glycoside hydrolase family 44
MKVSAMILLCAALASLVAGCGGGAGSSTNISPPALTTPTVTVSPSSSTSPTTQALVVTVTVNGGSGKSIPTGTVALTSGTYASASTALSGGSASINVPAGSLASGDDTLTATYTPDAASVSIFNGASGTASVTVTSPIASVSVTPSSAVIGAQQQFTATVSGTGTFSTSVTWALSCPSCGTLSSGTLSSTGLYTTPYPAPQSVTITATSTEDPGKSGSVTVALSQPAPAAGPALTVDVANQTHSINPLIYGVNGYVLDAASERTIHPSVVRWGGDAASRYNYQTNITNSASDYYFENFNGMNSPGGGSFTGLISSNTSAGAETLGTVPLLGWISNGTLSACSFTKASYPNQQSYDSDNCGNGVNSDGTEIFGNSTIATITSIEEPPPSITSASTPGPGSVTTAWANSTWAGGWVTSLVGNPSFGSASGGTGVAIWELDNEPTWWDAVHRDVHPAPFTYDEVTNGGIGSALAIKTADPSAAVSGPVIDYWWAYFYSKQDIENGWSSGPCYEPWDDPKDRMAHGGIPMIEYYLQQFSKYSQSYGIRLLDYLDIHGYFAPSFNGASVAFTTAGDTGEQEARMNGTRVFWDPTYTDPSYPQPNYVTDSNYTTSCSPPAQAPQLINTLQTWVNNDYPGTKTAIDEYNFGGLESINGAVTQADILGIFGRQGLDMAALWPTNDYDTQVPGNFAFAMYRNYDGNNSTFGDTALASTSDAAGGADGEGQLAVYGAQRSSDGAITVMVLNKTYGDLNSTLSLANFTSTSSTAQVYLYSNGNLNAIVAQPAISIAAPSGSGTTSAITTTFPAQSITLLVIPK